MKDISRGFIALYRQFLEWEWFTDVNTCHLFQYCLLRANYKNTTWRGQIIKKGQFITSLRTMSIDTGLSLQQVRTSLKKLTHGLTCELTHETTTKYSIITVKNYNLYQCNNTQLNKQLNKQITTDNKLISNTTNRNINISLSIEERENLKKYILAKKKNVKDADAYIRKLLDNGDVVNILEKAKRWKQKQEEKLKQDEILRFAQNNGNSQENEEEVKKAMAEAHKKVREIIKKGSKK